MERHRKMDAAGPSRKRRALIVFLLCPLYLTAQTPPSNAQFIEHAHQLLNEQRWQEVVEILQSAHPRSADLDFYYGTALAKLGRWQEAHDAFESGARLQPQDNRFPLELPELLLSHSRVHGLGIFPSYSFDLVAREDGAFDVVFRDWERNGWGHNRKEGLFLLLRGLPFQTINPELYNLKHEAINFVSVFRWDAEKRRVTAQLSSPFKHNPKFNYQLFTDLRSENWNIQTSFQGPTTLLGSLNLRREAIGANFTSFASSRWRWSAGAEISHRDFRSVIPGTALTPILLAKGYQLKQAAQVEVSLWRAPERRMNLDAGAHSEAGRIWSQPSHSFEKLQGSARFHWFP